MGRGGWWLRLWLRLEGGVGGEWRRDGGIAKSERGVGLR